MICECGVDHHAGEHADEAAVIADAIETAAEVEAETAEAHIELEADRIESHERIETERIAADVAIVEAQAEAAVAIAEAQAAADVAAMEAAAEALSDEGAPPDAPTGPLGATGGDEQQPEAGGDETSVAPAPVAVPPQLDEEPTRAATARRGSVQVSRFRSRRPR